MIGCLVAVGGNRGVGGEEEVEVAPDGGGCCTAAVMFVVTSLFCRVGG